jgi:hypothetical protein
MILLLVEQLEQDMHATLAAQAQLLQRAIQLPLLIKHNIN